MGFKSGLALKLVLPRDRGHPSFGDTLGEPNLTFVPKALGETRGQLELP